jgi:hypothetical protein
MVAIDLLDMAVLHLTLAPSQIAVFGINGPISVAPSNFIFFRDAKVEFYR